ncbi:DUF6760 family protein [Sphaerisporangium rhizosphaerae]|uniref:DUF6760 family protein n=1 Tax=Sphaerisporangium rhizosphaerae TaxID=2269375 RepID=A0ABW2PIA6_9ACTN
MPELRARLRVGAERPGGISGYLLDALYEEVAFLAFHFHWPRSEVLELEHSERRRWVAEISALNARLTEAAG